MFPCSEQHVGDFFATQLPFPNYDAEPVMAYANDPDFAA